MTPGSLVRPILITLLVAASVATANDSYQTHCAHCHGVAGQGNHALRAPNLTLQSESYIKRQLQGFKEGWRKGDDKYAQSMMTAIAMLDAANLDGATRAIEALPDTLNLPVATNSGNKARGKDLYIAYCSACHGTNATGNDALGAPNLLGLSSDYLNRQYLQFAEGKRGAHPNDRYGQQMARLTRAVKDPQLIDDISTYVASLAE